MSVTDGTSTPPRPQSGRKGYNQPANRTVHPSPAHLSPNLDGIPERGRRALSAGRKGYNSPMSASSRSASHSPSPMQSPFTTHTSLPSSRSSSHCGLGGRKGYNAEPQDPKPNPDPSGRKGYNSHHYAAAHSRSHSSSRLSPSPSPSPWPSSRSSSTHAGLGGRGCRGEPEDPKPNPDPSGRKGYNNHHHQHRHSEGHIPDYYSTRQLGPFGLGIHTTHPSLVGGSVGRRR